MIYKAKKSMGQNFLKSQEALNKMCEAGSVNGEDIILEIGPGKGALTEKLLEKAKLVIAVEKDRDLIEPLTERFTKEIKSGKLKLINEDILNFNTKTYNLETRTYKIIANIPYNITGVILKKFLSCDNQPERMILLVQKEVAERIVTRDNKESILSLSVKAYGTPKYIMKVHKRFFSPEPKVDSAIIAITNISKDNFKTDINEKNFFNTIKAGFAHKRKVLRRNLEDFKYPEACPTARRVGLPDIKNKIDEMFKKLGINPKARAEDIKLETWLEISHSLSTNI